MSDNCATLGEADTAGDLIVAEYECPVHGRFQVTVKRVNGDPPDEVICQQPTDRVYSPPGAAPGCAFWSPHVSHRARFA